MVVITRIQSNMTLPQKAARVLTSFLLIVATMSAGAVTGAQSASPSGNQNDDAPLAPEELDNLVAPIAHYPDALMTRVRGAATFPDQVTNVDGWMKRTSRLTGEPLMREADKESWDPAVKALTQFPSVLADFAFLALFAIISPSVGFQKSEQAAAGPKMSASQEDAGKAIYDASKAGDSNMLLLIFGPDAKSLLFSGDPVQDKAALAKFTSDYDQMHRWRKLKDGPIVLYVGAENYPFPFPLVSSSSGQWYFDINSAKGEILAKARTHICSPRLTTPPF